MYVSLGIYSEWNNFITKVLLQLFNKHAFCQEIMPTSFSWWLIIEYVLLLLSITGCYSLTLILMNTCQSFVFLYWYNVMNVFHFYCLLCQLFKLNCGSYFLHQIFELKCAMLMSTCHLNIKVFHLKA